jgi:EAL domain-containing protein (putative c-di-GMP-specific phosphodiesterase class I)
MLPLKKICRSKDAKKNSQRRIITTDYFFPTAAKQKLLQRAKRKLLQKAKRKTVAKRKKH